MCMGVCVPHVYECVVSVCVLHVYVCVSCVSVCYMCDVIQADDADLQCDLIALFTSRTVLASSNYHEDGSKEITDWLQSLLPLSC